MANETSDSVEFPSLSEIEAARHEILDRVAANVSGSTCGARAFHTSHSSSPNGTGHNSTVSNRPTVDDQPLRNER